MSSEAPAAAAAASWTEARSREVLQVLAIKDAQLKAQADELGDLRARHQAVQIRCGRTSFICVGATTAR